MIGDPVRHEGYVMAGTFAWVVPGPIHQVTGGYLYDARIVDGLRSLGHRVGIVDLRVAGWPHDLAAGRRLTGALERHHWDAVVVDELAHPALWAALRGDRLRQALAGAPLVLLVHHLRCSEPGPWRNQTVARLVETEAIRAADLVVCTSETTARTVRRLAAGTLVEVVRPGWDTHASPLSLPWAASPLRGANIGCADPLRGANIGCADVPTAPQPPLHHNGESEPVAGAMDCAPTGLVGAQCIAPVGGGASSVLRLLLVGHWTPRKGILEALEALSRVRVGVTLDLVGEQDRDPTYATRVRRALQSPELAGRVRVHGRVPTNTLARLYAEADALLLPSTHEGYGMVLAEALAAGLPIIATRVGAVSEVVRDGLEAELVPPAEAWAMARAITRLADPAERQRRAAHARGRAVSLPRWSSSVAAFDALLTRLITTPRLSR
jgi:glycosyltransferase involved in cell wall biosynthesis